MKIISRIKGGLGNQLFCYAAARRLSLHCNAELVLDNVSGFVRDKAYNRKYALNYFNVAGRFANRNELLQPFERARRGLLIQYNKSRSFRDRSYLKQEFREFDERLVSMRPNNDVIVDGLWQSEQYFIDVESEIRKDLIIKPPADSTNLELAEKIRSSNSVAIHVRWFDAPQGSQSHNASIDYYTRALAYINSNINPDKFYVFSDDPDASRKKLRIESDLCVYVSNNNTEHSAYLDMWLMQQCKHFIIANSTFSWWGAWLGANVNKCIIAPKSSIDGPKTTWNFAGQIPAKWIKL